MQGPCDLAGCCSTSVVTCICIFTVSMWSGSCRSRSRVPGVSASCHHLVRRINKRWKPCAALSRDHSGCHPGSSPSGARSAARVARASYLGHPLFSGVGACRGAGCSKTPCLNVITPRRWRVLSPVSRPGERHTHMVHLPCAAPTGPRVVSAVPPADTA